MTLSRSRASISARPRTRKTAKKETYILNFRAWESIPTNCGVAVEEFSFMQNEKVISGLSDEIREYAAGRAKDVARGAETPWLAALLPQKYGHGLLLGARIALGCPTFSTTGVR